MANKCIRCGRDTGDNDPFCVDNSIVVRGEYSGEFAKSLCLLDHLLEIKVLKSLGYTDATNDDVKTATLFKSDWMKWFLV